MRYYGTDYYPEQETREDIIKDAESMRAQGFNVIRIGEFAWSLIEPCEGKYNTEWLTDVVRIFGAQGIKTIICTPTACPPVWLFEKHPEIAYVDSRGVKRPFGGRRHYCYNQEIYREYCRKIVRVLAQCFEGNNDVLGWHIDNELAQEATGRCHCPACKEKFHVWLKNRFGTIEEFNTRAGTVFWNQIYERFEQIPLPQKSIEVAGEDLIDRFFDNPTLRLEYERFCSDSLISFAVEQKNIIKEYSDLPVTTNTTEMQTNSINYYKLYREMDVVAADIYPGLRKCDLRNCNAIYAFTRGIKNSGNFWMVETSSGGGLGVWNCEGIAQPYPGTLRQMAIHAMTSGVDVLSYFQYKSFRYGAEQLEAAVMDIDGVPRRKNAEFKQASKDIAALTPILENTTIKNEAAVCFDYDCDWSIRIKPFNKKYSYTQAVCRWHSLLASAGIQADIIALDDTIFRYKTVVIPNAVIISEEMRQKLKKYVSDGGTVIATYLTSQKNTDNNADRVSTPAGLTDLFGMRVGEVDIVKPEYSAKMSYQDNNGEIIFTNELWTEVLELSEALPLVTYRDSFRSGEVAASINSYGKGFACYIGTEISDAAAVSLLTRLAANSGISTLPIRCPGDCDVIVRRYENGNPVYFLFNGSENDAQAMFTEPLYTVDGTRIESGTVTLPAKAVMLLSREPKPAACDSVLMKIFVNAKESVSKSPAL